MKNFILVFAIGIMSPLYAQSNLDFNNANITLSEEGYFFTNSTTSFAGYEIPSGSGNHTCYTMTLWAGGTDIGSMLHGAFNTYPGTTDYFPGPIANDYLSSYYTTTFGTSMWEVSQATIDNHNANYMTGGYVPDATIANWPGNGDVSEGVAAQLAPYIDVNGDQIYNPMDGDYPYIQGDKAVYVILNDAAGIHGSGADIMGIEVHFMFYQIAGSGDENNTTFMNMKIFNRGTVTYNDFMYGLFLDYDLGYYGDDYVGCDSSRNLSYVYNSIDNDPGGGGQPGYGANPPAFGTVFLNQEMNAVMAFSNGGGDPVVPTDYYTLMQAKFISGTHLVNDGASGTGTGYETNYAFSGNPYTGAGWSEITAALPPGDRRIIMSSDTMVLYPGESICLDAAFVYDRSGANNLENVNNLLSTTDAIKSYYLANLDACSDVYASVDSETLLVGSIYPNPSSGAFTLDFNGIYTVEIFDLEGRRLLNKKCNNISTVELQLAAGTYLIKVSSEEGVYSDKLQIVN